MACVAFVKTSSLGDVVHHMPAIADARRHMADARIIWVVEEAFAPLARMHPGVDQVIAVSTRRWRSNLGKRDTWREVFAVREAMKRLPVDVVVDTQGLVKSAIIARSFGGVRHGYDRLSIREPIASLLYDVRHAVSRKLHAVQRNRTLSALSLNYQPAPELDYGLRVSANSGSIYPYSILFHGTSRPEKEWRPDHWVQVGMWLKQRGLKVLLPSGSELERKRAEFLRDAIPGSEIVDRLPLDQLAAIVAGATIAAGVDTGLVHLAAAFGVPLVALFLASNPDLTGPVGNGPIAIVDGRGRSVAANEVIQALEKVWPPESTQTRTGPADVRAD